MEPNGIPFSGVIEGKSDVSEEDAAYDSVPSNDVGKLFLGRNIDELDITEESTPAEIAQKLQEATMQASFLSLLTADDDS